MKNFKTFLLVAVVVLLVLVAVYGLVQYVIRLNVTGTWTTEDGSQTIKIRQCYLVYTYEEIDIKERRLYVTKNFDFEDKRFFLKPTKLNRIGILGMFEKIEYRDHRLFGGILISDVGYKETEFRKNWDAVTTK